MRGRGWSRGGGGYGSRGGGRPREAASPGGESSSRSLRSALQQLHRAPYMALRDIENVPLVAEGGGGEVTVTVTRVQPDPFAPGSQVTVTLQVPWDVSPFVTSPIRRIAAEDFLFRRVHAELKNPSFACEAIELLPVSQHVLERSALSISVDPASVVLNCRVQIPGPRRILDGGLLERLFCGSLVPAVTEALQRPPLDLLASHVDSVEDQEWLRQQLPARGLVAFVANGSVLPRSDGSADTPLKGSHVAPFASPKDMEVSFTLPRQQRNVSGMGIQPGLTLLVGGGFQGKSTLLRAIEVGIYNHVVGDGREYVVTDPSAVKIRSEDRRSIQGVNIDPFVSRLHCSTESFCTSDASGSTSQAANMVEAMELGSRLLLLDEDTCATNLMYRDAAMCELIPQEVEPITTLLQRLPSLLATGVSLIVVAGGSGQYFSHAKAVVAMRKFVPQNVTNRAREIAATAAAAGTFSSGADAGALDFCSRARLLDITSTCAKFREDGQGCRVRGHGTRAISVGSVEVDLSLVEQLVEVGQVNSISACLAWLVDNAPQQQTLLTASAAVAQLTQVLVRSKLRIATPGFSCPRGFLSMPRPYEIGAALNRLRTLRSVASANNSPKVK